MPQLPLAPKRLLGTFAAANGESATARGVSTQRGWCPALCVHVQAHHDYADAFTQLSPCSLPLCWSLTPDPLQLPLSAQWAAALQAGPPLAHQAGPPAIAVPCKNQPSTPDSTASFSSRAEEGSRVCTERHAKTPAVSACVTQSRRWRASCSSFPSREK